MGAVEVPLAQPQHSLPLIVPSVPIPRTREMRWPYDRKQGPAREGTALTHVVAHGSLHDGGGIFALSWALIVIPLSIGMIINLRGSLNRVRWRGSKEPMRPWQARLIAVIFLCGGIFALYQAIHRFMLGGY